MSAATFGHYRSRVRVALARLAQPVTQERAFQAVAFLIALAAAWPLLAEPGLNATRGGGDSPFLLQRLQQLEAALRDGHFPARWMPDANYGYGFPFFQYYASLSFYIAAIFRLAGFTYVRALQLTQLAGFGVAAFAMFHLGQRWFKDNWAGLLASTAYSLAPFHLVNVYVRGDSLGEFWAMAFYPLTILTGDNLLAGQRNRAETMVKLGLFAASYAGLILSHNISALIFTPFLLLYLMLRWGYEFAPQKRPPAEITGSALAALIRLLGGGLLALALAAHFFLPALAERSLAQLAPVTSGYFYFGNHFQDLDLIQRDLLFDYDPAGSRAFHTGLVQIVAAVGGVAVLFWMRFRRKQWVALPATAQAGWPVYLFVLLALLVATFMITPLSRPLWEQIPLLLFTQFPWRFLSVQAVATALATAGLALLPGRRLVVPILILLFLVSSLSRVETAPLILTDSDVTPQKLAQYEWFTGNIGSTVSAEYLPHSVQPRSYTSQWLNSDQRDRIQPLTGNLLAARQVERKVARQTWQVTVAAASEAVPITLSFPTIHWPGWEASVDGERDEVWPAPGSGLITLALSPGEHQVELRLVRTPIRLAAELISLAAILILVWLFWPAIRRWRLNRTGLSWMAVLAGLMVVVRLWPEPQFSANDLTWDFTEMGYLHHAPDGILFDNEAMLQSYEVSSEVIAVGETLMITLHWQDAPVGPPPPVTLSLASPAVNRFDQAPLLVSQSKALETGETAYQFAIPENAPGGLYVPRLQVENSQALMSANRLRGDLFLRPVRIVGSRREAEDEGSLLDLRAVQVRQRDAGTLDLQLAWLTRQPISQNLNFSLRLLDGVGFELAKFDGQPGYGFLPSTGWLDGHWVDDWLALPLPETLSDNWPYHLMGQLYEVNTGRVVLTRFLGDLLAEGEGLTFKSPQPGFDLPEQLTPHSAIFEAESGPVIQLRGFDLQRGDDRIDLTLYWEALTRGKHDYTRFAHLVNPHAETPPITQNDSMPQNDLYPTGQWAAGEIVADRLTLDLSDVPAGTYQLAIGFYRNLGTSFPRLAVTDGNGRRLPSDSVHLPLDIVVDGK